MLGAKPILVGLMSRRHEAWACDLNGITQQGRFVEWYIITSAWCNWLYIHTPIHVLCNANQITGQMPSCFYIKHLNVNWSIDASIYNLFKRHINSTACWSCATLVTLVFWITCACSACTCCLIYGCRDFTIHGRWHSQMQMIPWAVTSLIMWLLCEHDVEVSYIWVFNAHAVDFFNTSISMPWTDVHFEVPMSRFLNRRGDIGRQALNLGCQPTIHSKYHLRMSVYIMYTRIKPSSCGEPAYVWVSYALKQERPSMLCKIYKVNFTKGINCRWSAV